MSNEKITIAQSAIGSMNFFFLRYISKKPDFDYTPIKEELQNFLLAIDETSFSDYELKQMLSQEIADGDYFYELSASEIATMLREGITLILGDFHQESFDAYFNLIINVNK